MKGVLYLLEDVEDVREAELAEVVNMPQTLVNAESAHEFRDALLGRTTRLLQEAHGEPDIREQQCLLFGGVEALYQLQSLVGAFLPANLTLYCFVLIIRVALFDDAPEIEGNFS